MKPTMTLGTGDNAIDYEPFGGDAGLVGMTSQGEWVHPSAKPLVGPPRHEGQGRGQFRAGISGVIYPGQLGRIEALRKLQALGDSDEPHPLVDGTGHSYGLYRIKRVSLTRTHWLDGVPVKIEFTLELDWSLPSDEQ